MRYQPRYGNGVQEVAQKVRRAEMQKKLAFDDIWAANLAVPEPIEACVHSLIKRVVWEFASSPAIRSWDGDLTYQQLDQVSTRLAHQLIGVGVKPRTNIALCFEKTWLTPVVMVALMKAGAASIALDISQPRERLRVIADQISPSFILSSTSNEELARQLGVAEVVVVDRRMLSEEAAMACSLPAVSPSDTLCIILSPDSSAGAAVTHREFSSAITYQQETLGLTHNSRVVDIESHATRIGWYSLLVLTCGGCLCIPSLSGLRDSIESSIIALQADSVLLAPEFGRTTPEYAKISHLVRPRHVVDVVTPSDATSKNPFGTANGNTANVQTSKSYTENQYAANGATENGHTENGCTQNGHTESVHTEDGYAAYESTEDGHPTNDHEKTKRETHIEHQPEAVRAVLDQGSESDNSQGYLSDKQDEPLNFVQHTEQVQINGNHFEIHQTPIESVCTTQEKSEVSHADSREPAITPLSLLGLRSSADRDQACSHAAWLCHVQASQVLDIMPCTPLQQGLLALTAQQPGTYVARYVFEIGQDIDIKTLCGAWDRVVASNAILRTRIVSLPGLGIVQVVIDEGVSWTISTELDSIQGDQKGNGPPIGLGTPLTKFTVIEKATDTPSQFIWEIHHSLYDGFSMPLLMREAELAYFNKPSQGLQPMTAFIKYILDQDKAVAKSFWQKMFAGTQGSHFPPPKAGHHPRLERQMSLSIPGLKWGHSDFTPATLIRAAWSVVTANGSGTDEALFGATVTGRQAPVPGIELMAGPTIATVPIRILLDRDATINQLLGSVQRQAVDMIPFEQTGLQNIAQFNDETALGSNFQTLLVIQPADQGESDPGRPFLDEPAGDHNKAQGRDFSTYAIVIECQLELDGVNLCIDFDSSVMGQEQIEHIAQSFKYTISQLSDSNQGNQTLRGLHDDQWGLRRIWNWNAVLPKPMEACIHDMVSERARENPSALAVNAWDGNLTYRQLEDLSTNLAYQLSEDGVSGTIVPLLFEKSMFMPVAALAVMKAGGACMAMDIKQPRERLTAIAAQANSPVILSSRINESLAFQVSAGIKEVVTVGSNQSHPAPFSLPPVSPAGILYVVLTSGTTGTPKGVLITHRNFCSAITYQQKILGCSNTSRVLDLASYAFDVAWSNMLHTFTAGGTLCIPSQTELENDLPRCLEKYDVTYADMTPSVARIVSRTALSRLNTLILGGETVLPSDAYLAGENTRVFNAYGPSECTPTATLSDATADCIGHGAGVCIWVVEPDNPELLAPIGSIGELYLEGPLVGEGYLNDPEKTATVFVDDPVWLVRGIPGQSDRTGRRGRLYRTGDLVKYKEDGSLVILGRKDTQVKIRGQRVELGEVEQHVLDAALPLLFAEGINADEIQVIAETIRPEGANNAILLAFISLGNAEERNMTEESHSTAIRRVTDVLADRLTEVVPIYMVPTAFVPIYKLPIMTSGKTDRRQLRAIGEAVYLQYIKDSSLNDPAESLSDLEIILQQVWMSVLGVSSQEASVNKPFTRLGGDSISAMQAVSQGRLHNITFTVGDLLKAKTIRNLAALCRVTSQHVPEDEQEDERDGEAFEISPVQQMFFDAYPEGLNHFNQSFVLELQRPVETTALRGALETLLQRHPLLRARYNKSSDSGRWMQAISMEADTQSFAFAEHFVANHDEIAKPGQLRQESFDIKRGPLFAIDLFNIPDKNQIVILSAHHLVIDLVSWRIIWNDIEEYITHGKLLSQPTTSFRTWCKRQANIGRNLSPLAVLPYPIPESQIGFWGLPLSENKYDNVEIHSKLFDIDVSDGLFGGSNVSLKTEPVDIIIGSMVHSFLQTFPERDPPAFWMEGHGRDQSDDLPFDVSGTVGWFTTIYPLVVRLGHENSAIEAIRMAKDNRQNIPGKGQPYFACRYHSESGREVFQGHDVVEVLFNYTGRYQQLEAEDGLFMVPDYLFKVDSGISEISKTASRPSMIEIDANVDEGMFLITFNVHRNLKHQDRIQEWIETFAETLRSVTQELLRSTQSFTLGDLPLLSLSYDGLDTLLTEQLPSMGIRTDAVADIYPCSPLQEGVLLSSQKEISTYATFSVWECVPTDTISAISPSRLEEAWKTVVSRHTILQSVFSLNPEGNAFIQIVVPESHIRVTHLTVDHNPSEALNRLQRPKFAANEPEHAFTICQSRTGEVSCRLDANHTLVDAASMSIIVGDIIAVYDNYVLPPAPPFRDMIQYISSTPSSQRIASWTKLLNGVEPCEFPVLQANPEKTESESRAIPIPVDITSDIAGFCKTLGITRSVFLQVAWAMTLSQLTGKSEACFGYLASGRDSAVDSIETMVGPLANLLVGRVDLRTPARKVLETTMEKSIEHLNIQHTSLAEIQHQLGLSGRRLFNTSLSIQASNKAKTGPERKKGLSFKSHNGEDSHEYDLTLHASIEEDVIKSTVEFRAPYVSQNAAQEAVTTFIKAIQYLLDTNINDKNVPSLEHSLVSSFFKHVVGTDEQLTRSFWKTHFANIQGCHFPPVKAATYRPWPNRQVRQSLQGLKWANRGGFEVATILRASWSILATRILGSNEALFGVTSNDDKIIVPARILLNADNSIAEFLQEVQRQAYEVAPFERTGLRRIRLINDESSLGCDIQMLLHVVDHSYRVAGNQPGDIGETEECWQESLNSCAMIVETQVQANRTDLCIRFDSSVIGELQVTRITNQFEHILHQLLGLDMREQKIRTLAVISPRDVRDIWTWNTTVADPVKACVHHWIIQRAREQPLAPAISAWDGDLTYGQLLELSTNLSYELVKIGVGHGSIVPLCFEKSMWMPVAALAVIQTGAAAVALDPASQPEERIRTITKHVKATVILSSVENSGLAHRLGINEVVIVGRDQLSDQTTSQTDKTPGPVPERYLGLPSVDPSQLLCVIFTSGSTGAPKGVKLLHKNYSSAIAYQRDALGYVKGARVLDFSSYAFDVVWANLLNTLTAGGCLCIPSSDERQNNLSECFVKYNVTMVDLPPSLARHTAGLSSLSTLVLGGEAVLPTDAYLAGDKTRVVNAYGPAECTPSAAILDLSAASEVGLGRGVGVCTWVVEPDNPDILASIGAVGELWLEGPTVGDGYLDDPVKTAAAFVQDPAWLLRGVPGGRPGRRGRVYRTGDLVRYRDDGSLLFIGRKDTQVKIRGQRVELEEVEHHLQQALSSKAAGIQVFAEPIQPRGTENKILAAFITLDSSGEEHDSKVKQVTIGVNDHLSEVLPLFMIPTVYIPLQNIPRSITGKIDRRQLREIGSSLTAKDIAMLSRLDGERRAPESDMERLIQRLWAEVLQIDLDSISADDSFIRMGGDSIGAIRLVGVARQNALSLTIRDVFQNPILRDLATVCAQGSTGSVVGK
ncbi:Nonribosomal Peptide Synthase (NRPS) [Pseudogymnoascus sp. 23342-1-I1]|nr:Nonribosomal Peptide Synthase (NRPS) [Pseudogymnoascus sp. 23342-1-I1]